MELRQLKSFLMVAQLLNFKRAGELLHYAQSTISAQIKALEKDFGVALFDRIGKRVVLTEAGRMLMRYAQKMLDIEKETIAQLSGWEEPHGVISIRIPQSLGFYYLPSILQQFQLQFPKVGFEANTCAFFSLQQELRAGVIDLAFLLAESVNAADLKTEVLRIEPLLVVSKPKHKLIRRSGIQVKDLAEETILLAKHDCGYTMEFKQLLTEEKVKPRSIMEFNSIETIKQCVGKGIGVSLLPKIAVEKELKNKELALLPWQAEQLETAILMIRHKNKWISPTLKAFIKTTKEVVNASK